MPCLSIRTPSGLHTIACTRGPRRRAPQRCTACHAPDTLASMRLCDGRVPRMRKSLPLDGAPGQALDWGPELAPGSTRGQARARHGGQQEWGTCDRVICTDCAIHVEPDLDYCSRACQQSQAEALSPEGRA